MNSEETSSYSAAAAPVVEQIIAAGPDELLKYYVSADPMPLPPRRRRRGRIALGLGAGVLVIALVTTAAVVGLSDLSSGGGRTASAGRTAAAKASPTAAPAATVTPPDLTTLNGALTVQSAALLAGDEKGWLATVDPHAHAALAEYKRIFHNMRSMKVAVWNQSSTSGDTPVSGRHSFSVVVNYCLVVKTCSDTLTTLHISAELKGGQVLVESLTVPKRSAKNEAPLPWLVANLSAVAGTRVVVIASSAYAWKLRSALADAQHAAGVADKYAHWGKPDIYVIYLAARSESLTWFGSLPRIQDYLGVTYPLSDEDTEAVLLMPQAGNAAAGPAGMTGTLQWILGAMATSYGSGGTAANSLDSGLDQYIEVTGHPRWLAPDLSTGRAYVRSGRWNHNVYLTKEVDSTNTTVQTGAIVVGYLAIRRMIQRFGLTKTLTFWGGVERNGESLSVASQDDFGKSWTSVNADCVAYIEHNV